MFAAVIMSRAAAAGSEPQTHNPHAVKAAGGVGGRGHVLPVGRGCLFAGRRDEYRFVWADLVEWMERGGDDPDTSPQEHGDSSHDVKKRRVWMRAQAADVRQVEVRGSERLPHVCLMLTAPVEPVKS